MKPFCFSCTYVRFLTFSRSHCSAGKHLKTRKLVELEIHRENFISQGEKLAWQITLKYSILWWINSSQMHVTTHFYCGLLFRDLNSRSLFQLQTINNFTETRILKPQKLLLFYNIELFGQCKVHTFSLNCFDIENIFETLKTFESIKFEIFC